MTVEPAPPALADDDGDQGVWSNARLTAANGMVLTVLLLVEGLTVVLNGRGVLTLHIFLGTVLIGPVLLKTASTVYRFVRYYQGAPAYRRKGPPHPVLRILGPLVTLSSLAVLGSGIGLLVVKPANPGAMLGVHRVTFLIWVAAVGVHFLGHIRGASVETWHELRPDPADVRGRRVRLGLVALALIAGIAVAVAVLPLASPWTSAALGGH